MSKVMVCTLVFDADDFAGANREEAVNICRYKYAGRVASEIMNRIEGEAEIVRASDPHVSGSDPQSTSDPVDPEPPQEDPVPPEIVGQPKPPPGGPVGPPIELPPGSPEPTAPEITDADLPF